MQEVACSAHNLMSMLLPKRFVKALWTLDMLLTGMYIYTCITHLSLWHDQDVTTMLCVTQMS